MKADLQPGTAEIELTNVLRRPIETATRSGHCSADRESRNMWLVRISHDVLIGIVSA
jgi:hypothetical protein